MKWPARHLIGLQILIFILASAGLSHATPTPLVSVKAEEPPKLDGIGNDAAWKKTESVTVEADDGPKINIRSVHSAKRIYFLISWKDGTASINQDKWIYDGKKWGVKQEKRWEDEDPWEADSDRFCFQWPLRGENLIKKFSKKGCAALCHKPEKENKMFTNGPHEASDIWQWRASTTNPLGYADDGHLDNTNISKKDERNAIKRINAAHKWDPLDPGGLTNVRNKKGQQPEWMSRLSTHAAFLIKGQEVPLEMSKIKKGDLIPGWVLARPNGSRGDINAKARYDKKKGKWTLELSRQLITHDKKYDVQFDDLSKTYYFGIAVWENDRLYGHTRVRKPFALTFQ